MREAKSGHLNLIAVTAIQLFSLIGFVFQNDTGGGGVSDAHSVEEVHLEAPLGKFASTVRGLVESFRWRFGFVLRGSGHGFGLLTV